MTKEFDLRIPLPNLNIENMTTLRNFLANMPEGTKFDHNTWFDGIYESGNVCGTVACVAGWACFLFDENINNLVNKENFLYQLYPPKNGYNWSRKGAEFLGLINRLWEEDYPPVYILFMPWDLYPSSYLKALNDVNSDPYSDENNELFHYIASELEKNDKLPNANNENVVAFLDRMIEHKAIDIRWWEEIIMKDENDGSNH